MNDHRSIAEDARFAGVLWLHHVFCRFPRLSDEAFVHLVRSGLVPVERLGVGQQAAGFSF